MSILWSGRNHEWKHTVKNGAKLHEYLAKRDALYRNPTLEGARKLMEEADPTIDLGAFERPDAALAALHKARLQWLGATDAMLAESIEWLTARNYETTARNIPPLTPDERDKQRAARGLPSIKGMTNDERIDADRSERARAAGDGADRP